MSHMTGVYETTLKNGTASYRVSITHNRKHISLGSFADKQLAQSVYQEGKSILESQSIAPEDYSSAYSIPFEKFVILVNLHNNGIYFPTPIYLRKQYFEYYLEPGRVLKFDRDDLFFYAAHKIQSRGGYLFVSDYGSQYKILTRYGIRPFAVLGRDYIMVNSDPNDLRYSNIRIINNYMGVSKESASEHTNEDRLQKTRYLSVIHINGNYKIGRYTSEEDAAIAYNKAVDILHSKGIKKQYLKNYIISMKSDEYKDRYNKLSISKKILDYIPQ